MSITEAKIKISTKLDVKDLDFVFEIVDQLIDESYKKGYIDGQITLGRTRCTVMNLK